MRSINRLKLINFFVVLAVIALLIFFNWRGLLSSSKTAIFWVANPFLKFFQIVDNNIFNVWNFFSELKNLSRENINLKNENLAFLDELSRLKEAEKENSILRQQLGVQETIKRPILMASIIGYDLTRGQYFLIDKGLKDNILTGLAVVVENFLVGHIVAVEQKFSRVLLISDSNSSVNAITQDTRAKGIIKGTHGLGMTMNMISIDAQINVGEIVLTSGLNEGIPQGLVVGRVAEIIKKENEIFQSAVVSPIIKLDDLERVFILLQ